MSILNKNKKNISSRLRNRLTNPNKIVEIGTVFQLSKRVLQFVLFQLFFFTVTLYLATNIPVLGVVLKYLLGSLHSIEHWFNFPELVNQIELQKIQIQNLETELQDSCALNHKLEQNLQLIHTDHPELFGEKANPTSKWTWKHVLGGTVVFFSSVGLLTFCLYPNSDKFQTMFDGIVGLFTQLETMNDVRFNAIDTKLNAISNQQAHQDNWLQALFKESCTIREGLVSLFSLISFELDMKNSNVTDNSLPTVPGTVINQSTTVTSPISFDNEKPVKTLVFLDDSTRIEELSDNETTALMENFSVTELSRDQSIELQPYNLK